MFGLKRGMREYVTVHTTHILPPGPINLWIELGGRPKWLPLNFGYHDVMRTSPIASHRMGWCPLIPLINAHPTNDNWVSNWYAVPEISQASVAEVARMAKMEDFWV